MSAQPGRQFATNPTARRHARLWFGGGLLLLLILVGWIGGSFLLPGKLKYEVTTENLIITTGRGTLFEVQTVSLGRINEHSAVTLRGGKLRFGREKPEYCVGYFLYGSLGEVLQAGNCGDRGVLIRTSGQSAPLVVTPADPDALIFALRNHQPGVFYPPPRSWAPFIGWLVLDILIFFGVGGILFVFLIVGPSRLRYTVRQGELEIRLLGKPVRLALEGAKVRRHRPLLGERLSGLILPGYIVGSFTYDHLATLVYASVKEEGILYDGEGRVFVTPDDIDGMLEALGAAGAEVVVTKMVRRR